LVVILQIWIVYTYASVAKWYPGWLDASVPALFMSGKRNYPIIGDFLQQTWVHWSISYVGILFDLLIVPFLLWKRTRLAAFIVSIFFHLFNSGVFLIGIFPYMSIGFALFFFSPETLQKRFLPKKQLYTKGEVKVPSYKPWLLGIFSIYFATQIALPLRHWWFTDDVLWTEEGHRLSWRMMLRTKAARLTVYVEEKGTGVREPYDYESLLSAKQQRSVKSKPDMLWQLAQRIEAIEAEKGRDVAVYMDSSVKVNDGVYHPFIDPNVDLAAEEWQHFKHHEWILPSPANYDKKASKK
jgi:hypothetical protein